MCILLRSILAFLIYPKIYIPGMFAQIYHTFHSIQFYPCII